MVGYIRKNPYKSIAVAAGLGLGIGTYCAGVIDRRTQAKAHTRFRVQRTPHHVPARGRRRRRKDAAPPPASVDSGPRQTLPTQLAGIAGALGRLADVQLSFGSRA